MKYAATIYTPNNAPRQLSAKEIKQLVWGRGQDGLLTCDGQTTESLLGVSWQVGTDVLYVTGKVAVWGIANAADYNAPGNPKASNAARKIHPALSCLVGPILIVEAN